MRTATTHRKRSSIRRRSPSGASSRSATTSARPAPISVRARCSASDGKTAQIPDPWIAAWKSFYDGIWTDHVSMTGAQFQTTDLNPAGYPFCAGKVAMSTNYLWSTYCLEDKTTGTDWNMAATPAYKGKTTAAFNADTFRILKSSKNPDQAFEVLQYLLDQLRNCSSSTAGPLPSSRSRTRTSRRSSSAYSQKPDWKVAKEGINFADVPNFEGFMPAYNQTYDIILKYGTKWQTTPA